MALKWRSTENFYMFGLRHLQLGVWGAFGISFDGLQFRTDHGGQTLLGQKFFADHHYRAISEFGFHGLF